MADLNNAPDSTTGTPDKAAVLTSVNDLKTQASQAAETAKSSLNALASEARGKVTEIVDTQKQAGADQLAGFAKAAQSAAGDLENTSPAVAQLVRDAATSVDQFAGNLRSSDLREVLSSVSAFARQQPVAFFAGSVLAGFVLARFLKSDATAAGRSAGSSPYSSTTGAGYRTWSSTHPDDRVL